MAKILIVDDSKLHQKIVGDILAKDGHQVVSSLDGREGLEMAKKEKPDLIILDVMLPNMDGFSVCRMLKFDEKYQDIPIIMFTSRLGEEEKKIGVEVKANDYLTKDFQPDQLLMLVNKHLKAKKC